MPSDDGKPCNLEKAIYVPHPKEPGLGNPYFHSCHGVYLAIDSDGHSHSSLPVGCNKSFRRFLTDNNLTPKLIEDQIDPVNFYYNDLNPEEYEKMLEISSQNNQSFD